MHNQQHADYFEAIIQLRPESKKLMDFVLGLISKRQNVRISKIHRLKKGVDIYITDRKFARTVGNQLKRFFQGTLTSSKTLHSRSQETSKYLYRTTICFRLEQREPSKYTLEQ